MIASPNEKSTPLVSILVMSGYLLSRRVYALNIGRKELETSAYYKQIYLFGNKNMIDGFILRKMINKNRIVYCSIIFIV